MKTDAQLRKAIMRRVYVVYWTRFFMQPQTRLAAALAIILGIASSVSLPHIIANALHATDLVGFSISAVFHTTLFVQLGVLTAGLILIWTIIDAISAPFAHSAHSHA